MLNNNLIGLRYTIFVIRAVCSDIFEIPIRNLGVKDVERSMPCVKHKRLILSSVVVGSTSWYSSGSDILL